MEIKELLAESKSIWSDEKLTLAKTLSQEREKSSGIYAGGKEMHQKMMKSIMIRN